MMLTVVVRLDGDHGDGGSGFGRRHGDEKTYVLLTEKLEGKTK